MKLNKKMQECFTPHVIMHSIVGLGIGITLVSLFPALGMLWLGIIIIIIGAALDMMRK